MVDKKRAAGFDLREGEGRTFAGHTEAAFALAERATGVRVTPDFLDEATTSAGSFSALVVRDPAACARMCRRGDLNPYALFGHQALNLARLPIPPLRRGGPTSLAGLQWRA